MENNKKYHKVQDGRTLYCDVDDTLIMWDSRPDILKRHDVVEVNCRGYSTWVIPHTEIIEEVKKRASRGYSVIIWSKGGSDWAEAVVNALNLDDYVACIQPKPDFYIDDVEDCRKWMGIHKYISFKDNSLELLKDEIEKRGNV